MLSCKARYITTIVVNPREHFSATVNSLCSFLYQQLSNIVTGYRYSTVTGTHVIPRVDSFLLYRHKCFTGKNITRKNHRKLHPGLEWRSFHILTSEYIDHRYCSCHSNIKFISSRHRVIPSICKPASYPQTRRSGRK